MPFQIVPDGAQVVVKGKVGGQDCFNTLGFRLKVAGSIQQFQCAALAALVRNLWIINMLPILPEAYEFREVTVQALDTFEGPQAEDAVNSGATGGVSSPPMPNGSTLAIAFRTGFAGRHNRGRNYWPVFAKIEVSGNEVLQGKADAIIAVYNEFLDANLGDITWAWSIISRKVIDVTGNGRVVDVASVKVNDRVIDSQRRRLPGRGQ